MNILELLAKIAQLFPQIETIITTILTAIHATPGSPAHTTAINATVVAPPEA
jgi:hypothetical protein